MFKKEVSCLIYVKINTTKMKSVRLFMMIFSVVIASAAVGQKLEMGGKAPFTDVKMTDVSGKKLSVDDVAGENGVLVLFSSNTCPFVLKWEGRYNELKAFAGKHKVGLIVVNSNCQNRQGVDSLEEMKKHASEKGYEVPYVVDAGSKLANSYGGQTTPHAFLLDSQRRLVYKGAIDDNYDDASKVKHSYVKDAIAALSAGKAIAVTETKPVGCSIKRAPAN